MSEYQYLCLACGTVSAAGPSRDDEDNEKCPKCGSTNVTKVSTSRLFGFFSGGG